MTQCKCGKGHASDYDSMCKFCRESTYAPTRAMCSRWGICRGQGLDMPTFKSLKNIKLRLTLDTKFAKLNITKE